MNLDISRLEYMFLHDLADFFFTIAGVVILLVIAWMLFGPITCSGCERRVSRRHIICPYCATRLKK